MYKTKGILSNAQSQIATKVYEDCTYLNISQYIIYTTFLNPPLTNMTEKIINKIHFINLFVCPNASKSVFLISGNGSQTISDLRCLTEKKRWD